jgi:hypothetical protein
MTPRTFAIITTIILPTILYIAAWAFIPQFAIGVTIFVAGITLCYSLLRLAHLLIHLYDYDDQSAPLSVAIKECLKAWHNRNDPYGY